MSGIEVAQVVVAFGHEIVFSGEEAGRSEWHVYHDGQIVANWSRPGAGRYGNASYPIHVTIGKRDIVKILGFDKAAKALVAELFGVSLDGNIFPNETYILRVSEIRAMGDVLVARVWYNHSNSTGSSAASKPVKDDIMVFDMAKNKILQDNKEFKAKNTKLILRNLAESI